MLFLKVSRLALLVSLIALFLVNAFAVSVLGLPASAIVVLCFPVGVALFVGYDYVNELVQQKSVYQ